MEKTEEKKKSNKKTLKIVMIIMILAGLAIRIVYVNNITYYEYQHDTFEYNESALTLYDMTKYIMQIYEEGKLPQNMDGEFYHPPLHFILSALWMKAGNIFTTDTTALLESVQYLTVIYSIALIIIVYKIFKELKINEKLQTLAVFVMSFHPVLIIMSGSINNDMLCFLLIIYTMYRLIKWNKKVDVKNTIILAISTGLAVMTKLNGAIVATPILYVFILKIYRRTKKCDKVKSKEEKVKKEKSLSVLLQLVVLFGIISLTIGMWYPIRNSVRFAQPLLYILNPGGTLSVGNRTALERLTPFSSELLKTSISISEDCNIPATILKTSLFGEFHWNDFGIYSLFYYVAICVNILIAIITVVAIIKLLITKTKKNKVNIIMWIMLFITNFISYLGMNIKLPYVCSMDFRYLLPTLVAGLIFVCLMIQNIKNKKTKNMIFVAIVTLTIILVITADARIISTVLI